MPTLIKDIHEACFLVKYGIDEKAFINLCQRLGVVASDPPQCSRCNQEMSLGKVKENDGFAWRCRKTVAVGNKKAQKCDTQVGIVFYALFR